MQKLAGQARKDALADMLQYRKEHSNELHICWAEINDPDFEAILQAGMLKGHPDAGLNMQNHTRECTFMEMFGMLTTRMQGFKTHTLEMLDPYVRATLEFDTDTHTELFSAELNKLLIQRKGKL